MGVTNGAGAKSMIERQHPACPDNGLLLFDDWEGAFESPVHDLSNPCKAPSFLAWLRKAELANAGNDVPVVVKFVYNYSGTYGKAVHEHLHGLGLAPRLYSVVELHRGLVMVVMERLAFQEGIGGWVELEMFENRLGDMAGAVRKRLEEIVDYLQVQQMVHADLRPKNILVKVDEQCCVTMPKGEPVLSLIDFDWSGLVDEARYPPFLNPRISWPTKTKGYAKVGPDDDRILLNSWWDAFIQPATTS